MERNNFLKQPERITTITTAVPVSLAEKIRELARKEDRTISNFLRREIEKSLRRRKVA